MAAFDRSIAEEASQEALIRLHRALPRWRGAGSIGAFIYGICKNTTADVLRKHARHSAKHFDVSESAWSAIADSRENPEQAAMRKELSTQLAMAMRSLESQDRALIFLFEVEEASIRELSMLFKIPEGTVKSRLSRIRARLAETLKEAGYGRE
jgi:RNA polymerase sigma-70 factor (ECF subfamily)